MDAPDAHTPRRGRRAHVWERVAENYLAWLLLMAGIAAAGAFLTALAGGFEGWTVVAAIATIVLFAGCVGSGPKVSSWSGRKVSRF